MFEYNFLDIFIIVLLQSILLFLYHIVTFNKKKKTNILAENLLLLESIIKSTHHDKIIPFEQIKNIELSADEVFIFSKDIYRDVKNQGQFADNLLVVSTFFDTVQKNLLRGAKYRYFLKKDTNFRHSLLSFLKSHKINDNVDFYIIPNDKFFFYNEVYLYSIGDEIKAFEYLPSISNEENHTLFFMELDKNQTRRLTRIKNDMTRLYSEKSKEYVAEIEENFSFLGGFDF